MWLLHPSIRDDDGKRLGLALSNPVESWWRPTERVKRRREAGRRARRVLTLREWGQYVLYTLPMLPLFTVGALAPVGLVMLGLPMWAIMPLAFPLGLIPAIASMIPMRFALRHRIAAWHLDAGYCPSCEYDLRPTQADERGRRRCPECGGVWRLNGV